MAQIQTGTCETCGGTGTVTVPAMDGSGWESYDCLHCKTGTDRAAACVDAAAEDADADADGAIYRIVFAGKDAGKVSASTEGMIDAIKDRGDCPIVADGYVLIWTELETTDRVGMAYDCAMVAISDIEQWWDADGDDIYREASVWRTGTIPYHDVAMFGVGGGRL